MSVYVFVTYISSVICNNIQHLASFLQNLSMLRYIISDLAPEAKQASNALLNPSNGDHRAIGQGFRRASNIWGSQS